MEEPNKQKTKEKPNVWFSLRNSLHCKSGPSDVHDPRIRRSQVASILTKKSGRSGCSRSISNLKDVIHGSKRHLERPAASCSPRSIGSSEFLNPIAHEVILTDSNCEFKITGYGRSTFVGTVTPGTPGPGENIHPNNPSSRHSKKKAHLLTQVERDELGNGGGPRKSGSLEKYGNGGACHRCGEHFVRWEALESHYLSNHAVSELSEGDSSRKIVEIICRSTMPKPETQSVKIDKVLKVHNMQKALARFEDYRETVKIKAGKLPKKHPRCLADGNELLRFHGTTLVCSLGLNGSSSLCVSEKCNVCCIIRNGFLGKREMKKGGIGVFTASTSGRALESIEVGAEDNYSVRKALIVCRVIAGRVHRPVESVEEIVGQVGFDSLAGKVGLYSNIEELYLLNPKALLPCFIVICKS
ncbi:zinc finger protein-related [Striga hermonthica]|uniref:Zinc finger protein-related n=1 Tax=Striga hermonthica TaxID=68872 RepID=A0A9N7R512_STRHE|nr:zinc finger protein-related [Striga hermonthica]